MIKRAIAGLVIITLVGVALWRYEDAWSPPPSPLSAAQLAQSLTAALKARGFQILASVGQPRLTNGQRAERLILALPRELPSMAVDVNERASRTLSRPIAMLIYEAQGRGQALYSVPEGWLTNVESGDVQHLGWINDLLAIGIAPEAQRPRVEAIAEQPIVLMSDVNFDQTLAKLRAVITHEADYGLVGEAAFTEDTPDPELGISRMTVLSVGRSQSASPVPAHDGAERLSANCCHHLVVTEAADASVQLSFTILAPANALASDPPALPECKQADRAGLTHQSIEAIALTPTDCPFDTVIWYALKHN